MAEIARDLIPWRERAFVTVAEAGEILGRSTTWVRDQLTRGPLKRGALPGNGPTVVTVSSVLSVLLVREAPRRVISPTETKAKNWRPFLRLVYSKT
jgi:hypothetical protein